ncbi:hypothetical protein KQC08_02110, partial [Leptospira sp. Pond_2020]|nr:hypothetical protein [Leptospira sp. Pond_2020]
SFVIKRPLPVKEGKKPRTKSPKIQRLITPERLQRKRRLMALKTRQIKKIKEQKKAYLRIVGKRARDAAKKKKLEKKRKRLLSESSTTSSKASKKKKKK